MNQETEEKEVSTSFNTYRCNLCNTVFSVPRLISNYCCPFCNCKNLLSMDTLNYANYQFLPFVDSISDAQSNYKSKIRFNPLIPLCFRKKTVLQSIHKVYFPCLLYNVSSDGDVCFSCTDKIKNVNAIPNQLFDTKYSVHIDFDNILICGFSKVADSLIQEINEFDLCVLSPLNVNNVRDSYLIPIDEDINEIKKMIDDKVMKTSISIVRSNINHQLKKTNENNLKLNYKSIDRVMVPVFFTKIKYHGKDYYYIMNGHTGKFVLELATSKWAIVLFGLFLFVLIMIVLTFVLFIG